MSDRKLAVQNGTTGLILYYQADVLSANDYYPFGMIMPGRNSQASTGYKFGFNEKLKDDDIYGTGNAYDFDARIYNPRLAKWLSVDPLQKVFSNLSPYNFCYNNPNIYFDPDGKLGIRVDVKYNAKTGKYTLLKISIDDDLRAVAPAPGVGNIGMDYHDYIDITVYDEKGNVDYSKNISQTKFRTNNLVLGKWWAKSKVNDGIFEDWGGVMWTSDDQKAGSEETRKGNPSFIANVDGLLAMVNGGKNIVEHAFEKKDLVEVLDKFAELIKVASDAEPADIVDEDNPNQAGLMKQIESLLSKNLTQPNTTQNIPKIEPGKVPKSKANTILYTSIGNVRVNSDGTQTCCQVDKKATDTVPGMKKNKTN